MSAITHEKCPFRFLTHSARCSSWWSRYSCQEEWLCRHNFGNESWNIVLEVLILALCRKNYDFCPQTRHPLVSPSQISVSHDFLEQGAESRFAPEGGNQHSEWLLVWMDTFCNERKTDFAETYKWSSHNMLRDIMWHTSKHRGDWKTRMINVDDLKKDTLQIQ